MENKIQTLGVVVIEGPNLKADLCQASVMPQTEEDQEKFITKYIVGADVNDERRNDGSHIQDSRKS